MDFHPTLPKTHIMFIYPSLCNQPFLHFHLPVLPFQPYQLNQHQLPHISTHSSSMATSHTSDPVSQRCPSWPLITSYHRKNFNVQIPYFIGLPPLSSACHIALSYGHGPWPCTMALGALQQQYGQSHHIALGEILAILILLKVPLCNAESVLLLV